MVTNMFAAFALALVANGKSDSDRNDTYLTFFLAIQKVITF